MRTILRLPKPLSDRSLLNLVVAFFSPPLLQAGNGIHKPASAPVSPAVRFIDNKGQISDVSGGPALNVLFKASAPGLDVFITEKDQSVR